MRSVLSRGLYDIFGGECLSGEIVLKIERFFRGLWGMRELKGRFCGASGELRENWEEKKIFLITFCGSTLHFSPKRNQIIRKNPHFAPNSPLSSRPRFPQTDCCKYNTCCKSHIFTQSLPQFLLFSISFKTFCPLTPNL